MHFATIMTGAMTQELNNRPHTSFSRIVFPYKAQTKKFEKFEFNPLTTEKKLTEEDVDRVLKALEKSKDFKPSIPKIIMIILALLVLTALALILILAAKFEQSLENRNPAQANPDSKKDSKDTNFLLLVFLLGVTNILIFVVLLIANCLYKKSLIRREKGVKKFLSDFNANEFSAKGMEWRAGTYGAWVSVELNYMIRIWNEKMCFGGSGSTEQLSFDDDSQGGKKKLEGRL